MTDLVSPPSYVRTPAARFLSSLAVDRSLARFDLAGGVAHVEMLVHTGILPPEVGKTLVEGLRTMAREVSEGTFPWRDDLEDVHTNIEVRLTALVGPAGASLHTARSRNDQVALDERLYLRAAGQDVAHRLLDVAQSLVALAKSESATPMPGYTHLQRAQVVTAGHWLLAHFWQFDRDLDRLEATVARSNVSPLGAGALAGSTLPIDPAFVAQRLGFDHPFENSIDAVSDRDYFAEFLFDLSLLAIHASALAEEIVLFSSKEFHFLDRTAALGSGSSLMPQKRNPDVAELVRGKAGRAVGDLVALLTVLKALPLAYDRDLQEDKGLVFDAVATLTDVLEAIASAVHGLSFDRTHLSAAAHDPELYATDLAERLTTRGVPFRTAYESVAALYASPAGFDPEAAALSAGLNPAEATQWFDPAFAVERRSSPGGPGSASIRLQLSAADARVRARTASLSSLERKVELIEELLQEEPK